MATRPTKIKTYGKKASSRSVNAWKKDTIEETIPPLSPIDSPFNEEPPMRFNTKNNKENESPLASKKRYIISDKKSILKPKLQATLSWTPFKLTNQPSIPNVRKSPSKEPKSPSKEPSKSSHKPLVKHPPQESFKKPLQISDSEGEEDELSRPLYQTPIRPAPPRKKLIREATPLNRKSGLRRQNRQIYVESSPETTPSSISNWSEAASVASPIAIASDHSSPVSPRNIIKRLQGLKLAEPVQKPLDAVLSFCGQKSPTNFDKFIDKISSDIIKVGEASYSEVFGYDGHVLKIMPFSDTGSHGDMCMTKHILQELQVTSRMSTLSLDDGKGRFVKLITSDVVKGRYSRRLLKAWDDFADEDDRAENERPDMFPASQLYCIMILEHGGLDLEQFNLRSWSQAWSAFEQAAGLLSLGENECEFEHRDLHWGNILLRHDSTSVNVTIIDYTLSRMTQSKAGVTGIVYNSFEDEQVFQGTDDYQFDIYRKMRDITRGNWSEYHPRTNAFWLHYLSHQLLFCKGLKKPRRSNKDNVESVEQAAHKRLHDFWTNGLEKAARKSQSQVVMTSAGDVVEWMKRVS